MKIRMLCSLPLALGLCLCLGGCERDDRSGTTHTTSGAAAAPDNTKINERDQPGRPNATNAPTPTDQANDLADLAITQQIRKALVADGSLSVEAQNLKVITANGVVTLRGPVKSEAERAAVVARARELTGHNRVDDQIEVEGTR
jgi:hyperosmotically inducible periplasmic protein